MKPSHDDALRPHFAQQRQCEHDHVPAWRPELLNRPQQPQKHALRWLPAALATACVLALAVFLADAPPPPPKLSDLLPVLLDSPPGELFASLDSFPTFESPSDFLLPTHLNLNSP